MARAIDAEELLVYLHCRMGQFPCDEYGLYLLADVAEYVAKMPTIEAEPVKHGYVPKEVLEQIQWERDVAIDQLNSYGVQFGEKADVQKVKHGEWRGWGKGGTYHYENYGTCSVCHEDAEIGTKYRNYCPNCGARMRVNKND